MKCSLGSQIPQQNVTLLTIWTLSHPWGTTFSPTVSCQSYSCQRHLLEGAYYVPCQKRLRKIKYGFKSSNSNVDLGVCYPSYQLFSFVTFKGCVRYIFASLFCKFKGEYLWNKEKCFSYQFESSFRSWDNQILTFQYSNVMTLSNVHAWNIMHILLNNLESKHSLVMKFGQFMQHDKRKTFIKKFCEKYSLETSSRPFLILKEYSLKSNLRRSACWFEQIW